MCDKAFDNYAHVLKFALKFSDKAVNGCFLYLILFPISLKLKKCLRVKYEDPFLILYCPYIYKTQKTCNEAVDNCLEALKFIPDWFVASKILEKFHDALLSNDNILFYGEDFSEVTFFANEIGILGVNLDKINLDKDNNFYEDDPDTTIHLRL